MKKFILILLAASLLMMMSTGCQSADIQVNDGSSEDKISVVATIFAPYDFVREVAGDKAEITMLLPPAAESHSYQPSPQDIIKIQNSDIFIHIGGEMDVWVDNILKSMDTDKMNILTLMECVSAIEEEIVDGMEAEEEESVAYDEHVWTSPKNTKLIIQKISDMLCEVDAKNASVYKNNTTAYLGKLDDLDAAFREVVDNATLKTIAFGDRFPFRYFADEYGLDYFAAFPGCSTETEPSAATVAFLIDKVNELNIPVIFHAELSNKKMANTISEATGAKVLQMHACHNISKTDFENGATYLELMTQNIAALKEALQ